MDKQSDLTSSIEVLRELLRVNYPHLPTLFHLTTCEGRVIPHRGNPLKERQKRKEAIRQTLFQAIETLKRQYPFIQRKLASGTSKEKAWAKDALDTIDRYNALLTKEQHKKPPLFDRIFGLVLFENDLLSNIIEIPSAIFLRFDSLHEEEYPNDHIWQQIGNAIKKGKLIDYSKTERDMFYMRAISLAKKSELPESLTKELASQMRKTAITAAQDESEESLISMMQVLSSFPGETITVEGRFKRNPSAFVATVPETGSFRLHTAIKQTGFPHPIQYTGWALPLSFLPENPLRIDRTPLFHTLHKIKKQLALDLLPNGRLNAKAKEILALKRRAFSLHQKELLLLHKKLIQSLLKVEKSPEVDLFFSFASSQQDSFDYLATTYHLVNHHFSDVLSKALSTASQQGLSNGDHKERFDEANALLEKELEKEIAEFQKQFMLPQTELERATCDFILSYGTFLSRITKKLLLQYFSELIGTSPPLLTSEELTAIALALRQVERFQEELESPLPERESEALEFLYKKIASHLESDIKALQESEQDELQEVAIAEELERYYNARYSFLRHTFKKREN